MASFNSKSIFQYASKSDIIKIITITSLFFVTLQFTRLTFLINNESDDPFYTHLYSKVALPATFKQLLYQPWSLITYMFSELNFMRLLGNMIWLWIFATVIEDLKGKNRILPIYLTGGIVGALVMITFTTLKPTVQFGNYAGSLASLSAVALSALMFKPKFKFSMFFGLEIPIWVFVAIFFALNIATIQWFNLSQLFLTIGGVIVGLGYTSFMHAYYEKCTDLFTRMGNYISNNDNFMVEKQQERRKNTMLNLSYKSTGKKEMTIDEILDKINEKGLHALSKEEKKRLDDYSKNP